MSIAEKALVRLKTLPLSEQAVLGELPALISAYQLGQRQADQIHENKPVGIILWVGGVRGGSVQFNDRTVSTTLLDYAQMVIAKGVLLEDCIAKNYQIQATDLAASNGRSVQVTFTPQDLDIRCVRVQLLGLINRFDLTKDDYRVVGIIKDALRSPILSHKKRKEAERQHFLQLLQRAKK